MAFDIKKHHESHDPDTKKNCSAPSCEGQQIHLVRQLYQQRGVQKGQGSGLGQSVGEGPKPAVGRCYKKMAVCPRLTVGGLEKSNSGKFLYINNLNYD